MAPSCSKFKPRVAHKRCGCTFLLKNLFPRGSQKVSYLGKEISCSEFKQRVAHKSRALEWQVPIPNFTSSKFCPVRLTKGVRPWNGTSFPYIHLTPAWLRKGMLP